MWYLNKDYILIHQAYMLALTWHYLVEFMKNTPCGNPVDVVHDLEVHYDLMLAKGFYTSPTCCFICDHNLSTSKFVCASVHIYSWSTSLWSDEFVDAMTSRQFNALWLSGAKWWNRSGSTLAQTPWTNADLSVRPVGISPKSKLL